MKSFNVRNAKSSPMAAILLEGRAAGNAECRLLHGHFSISQRWEIDACSPSVKAMDEGASISAQEGPALSPLISDPNELRAEYRQRRDPFDYLKVHPADVERKGQEGWQLDRTLTASVWLKKEKVIDRQLEDRVWCLFYRMGYIRS